jgi:hypothetical protein
MLVEKLQIFPSQNFPHEVKEDIFTLENRKDEILKIEEESWCLKSRVVWLKSGDSNTIFFHKFAENIRNFNTIWDVLDVEGNIQHSQIGIKATTLSFYSSLYKAKYREDNLTQINVLKEAPRFFTDEEINEFGKQFSL